MKASLCNNFPDLVQHIILEFLDYRLRNGKYIRRIPADLPIYELLQNRPKTQEIFFNLEDSPVRVNEHYDEGNDDYYYTDDDGNTTFFRVSILTKEYCQGHGRKVEYFQHRLEVSYCYDDYSAYMIRKYKYQEIHSDFWVRLNVLDEDVYG